MTFEGEGVAVLTLLELGTEAIVLLYQIVFMIMVFKRAPALAQMLYEIRPFFLWANPVSAVIFVTDTYPLWMEFIVLLTHAVWQLIAWGNKDDDDRWKKRRKKAAEKVKMLAGKLVVVPEPATT